MEDANSREFRPAFEFRCKVQWNDMQAMNASRQIKRCNLCERTVHLCGTVAEFEQHARQGSCVAVYENGPFAHMAEKPLGPLAPDPDKPTSPDGGLRFPPNVPTAGVPRNPDWDKPAPDRPKSPDT